MLVKKASLPVPFLPVVVAVVAVAVQAAESAQVQALPEIQVVVLELEVLPAEAVVPFLPVAVEQQALAN